MACVTTTRLDRNSPLPLWAQLEAELRARLEAGEFDDGFPTDAQLVKRYDVSRHTVREAIRHLNKTGVLRRERGRGTVVNKAEFEQPLGGLYSLFRSIEASGVTQTSEVLELGVVTNAEAANHLGLAEDASNATTPPSSSSGSASMATKSSSGEPPRSAATGTDLSQTGAQIHEMG